MPQNKKKRIGSIDFLKFIFTLVVVLYHGRILYSDSDQVLFQSGYMAVEFFFIVSGYLLAQKASGFRDGSVLNADLQMVGGKIRNFFPYLFVTALFFNLLYLYGAFSMGNLIRKFLLCYVDLFGLQMLGFDGITASGVSWYISALLFVSFLIYPVLCKHRQFFTKYLAPIIVLVIYGQLSHMAYQMPMPGQWLGVTYVGMLRGLAGISLGTMAFEGKLWLDNRQNISVKSLHVLELFGYLIALYYMIFHVPGDFPDVVLVPVLFLAVTITFSNKSILQNAFNHPIFNHLGIFSLAIYLNHYFIRDYLWYFYQHLSHAQQYGIYLSAVTLLSLLGFTLARWLARGNQRGRKYLILFLIFMLLAYLGKFLYGAI